MALALPVRLVVADRVNTDDVLRLAGAGRLRVLRLLRPFGSLATIRNRGSERMVAPCVVGAGAESCSDLQPWRRAMG
jgi:hypothetical protein